MARLMGIDIPDNKRIAVALTYIYGIGPVLAERILKKTNVSPDARAKELDDNQLAQIRSVIENDKLVVEGELRRVVNQNIRRLQDIRCYRGLRHSAGLPTRGQRTNSNARTRKGKRKTVGNVHKKATAQK